MLATKHAARDPFRVLECRHGLAEIVERGVDVIVESFRVIPPHLESESMSFSENASRHGYRLAHQPLGFFEAIQFNKARRVVVGTSEGIYRENYTMYKYVLNLPGSTSGSYSRNLNHLWSLDSVVLLWRDGVKEWYYPALEHGVTHLDVDKSDLVKAVRGLEADPSKASKLRKGAKRVEYAFTTPESLADYLIEVLRRAGRRFFSDVLDDACTARDFFATRVDCKKLGFLAEFDLAKVMKRGTRARSYGPGCRLILEHLSERCAANCLMGKTSNASRCSAFNDPSFDCGSRRCADACLRRDDATGRIECLNEMHVKNNSAAKCLLPREGVATRWCGVATPAPSPRPPPPSRSKKRTSMWHSLYG
jgi:hypothetical protein